MALIPGSIPVTGFIAPTDTTDTYPVTDAIYGIDGLRNVADHSARNNISLERRRAGMVVGTLNDGKYWRLKNQAWTLGDPNDWELFLQVGPSGSVVSTGLKYVVEATDDIEVPLYTQYWIYGDLTVYGQLTNYGQVVIADGSLVMSGGTFSNFGSLIFATLGGTASGTMSYINSTTIAFTFSGSTVSASVITGSLTASHLNSSGGATAGYLLSVNNSGIFEWVPAVGVGTITEVVAGVGLTGGGNSGSVTLNMSNTGVDSGTYGNAGYINTFNVNSQGQLTSVATQSISITSGQVSNFTQSVISLYATPSLSQTLAIDNNTYTYSIVMGTSQSISSANGGGQIDLDYNGTSSHVYITNDNGALTSGVLEVSNHYSGLAAKAYYLGFESYDIAGERSTNVWSTWTSSIVNIGVSKLYFDTYDQYQDISVHENTTSVSVSDYDRHAIFIGTRNSTFAAGITNSVILGGYSMSATSSNTVYVPNLQLQGNVLGKYTVQPDTQPGFDALTIVTKGYVDSFVGVTGGNGLNIITPGVVGLGGSFSQNTLILGSGYNMVIGSTTSRMYDVTINAQNEVTINSDDSTFYSTFVVNPMASSWYNEYPVNSYGSLDVSYNSASLTSADLSGGPGMNVIEVNPSWGQLVSYGLVEYSKFKAYNNSAQIWAGNTSSNVIQFFITANSTGAELFDGVNQRGINYAANYHAQYVNRTLVDKEYVDLAIATASTKLSIYDKNLIAIDSVGDGQFSGATISYTPIDDSYVAVYVNGQEFLVGDGVTMSVDCYFSGDGGANARGFSQLHPNGKVQANDALYWNGTVAGTNLQSGWRISLHYLM